MDSKRIPKSTPPSHRQPESPASKRLPLPTHQENLMRLQGMVGNQALQRLLIQRQVELEEMEIPVDGDSSDPLVLDEMEVPVDGGSGPVVMDEMEVPMGGSASGSGDSIVLPEDKITPGDEAGDSIVLPEDKITPGGGSDGGGSNDSIVLPEDKITPGSGEQKDGWMGSMWDTLTNW